MIGIYDSGIGGLEIFNSVRAILPQESIWYYGDTKYMPFGDRPTAEIRQIVLDALQTLASRCSIIVIACNTATVSGIDYYRSQLPKIPIIGVVPVIKTAAQVTQTKEIALLATRATCQSAYIDQLIKDFASNVTVHKLPAPGLADAIEKNTITTDALKQYLVGLGKADVVVLGCTHYSMIKPVIQSCVGPDVRVLDSNEAVARQVLRVMRQAQLEQPQANPVYQFDCSGDKKTFLQQVQKYTKL